MDNKTFNLWKLLGEYDVVVPVIQRDYAQGRKGKEYVRKTFLSEIKSYLCDKKVATLDFIYGNINGKRFYPLDGQQRLTTLWLIYWYVSFRAGKLETDCEKLKKFSYETRSSSRDFCAELCEKMKSVKYDDIKEYDGIAGFIKSHTWFYSAWLQDPTVSAILRTLGGDGNDENDNIDTIFGNCDNDQLRDRLITHPIINFELMIIPKEKLPISDDLYIKMNARGKGLTDFENFKADLVAWIQTADNPDATNSEIQNNSITYKQYYPSRIDNTWTDVFWKSASEKLKKDFVGRVDELYFSFINRFILNKICVDSDLSPTEFSQGREDDKHKDEKNIFDKLFGTGLKGSYADDSLVNYEGFEIYTKYITWESLREIDYILETVSNPTIIRNIEDELSVKDVDKDDEETSDVANGYKFIPQYSLDREHVLLSTSQKERVYFLAICNFILNCRIFKDKNFDETKFKRWMRVVRNLTENAAIDNVPAMVTCMRLIKKLSDKMAEFNNDIYECLSKYTEPLSNSQLECQLKEEKEKAEQILKDDVWEEKIKKAENFGFFNGTIRFLYKNVKEIGWDDFDKKFEAAKNLFSNPVPITTIEKLLKQFEKFDDIKDKYLFTSLGYHARHKCWKKDILCSDIENVLSKVHSMLMGSAEPHHSDDYQDFLDSGLIGKIVEKPENYKYRYHWHSYLAVHKDYSQTEGIYLSNERKLKNKVLKGLADKRTVTITDSLFNFYQNGYYWGVRVEFEYNGNNYRWYVENGKDKICNVINDKESDDSFTWINPDDLIRDLDERSK